MTEDQTALLRTSHRDGAGPSGTYASLCPMSGNTLIVLDGWPPRAGSD